MVANTTIATMTTVRIPLAAAEVPPGHRLPVSGIPMAPPNQFALLT